MALAESGSGQYGPINANFYSKCAPALSTNLKQCGTITMCNARPTELGELDTLFKTDEGSGTFDFRVMEALFHHDFEINMCESVQNGLYDLFMANKVNLSRKLTSRKLNLEEYEIEPFVLARQYSPINNEYFYLTEAPTLYEGQSSPNTAATYTISVPVKSTTNIPLSGGAAAQLFPNGLRVFIAGRSASGAATRTAWKVVDQVLASGATQVTLYLLTGNHNSCLEPNFSEKLAYPASGGLLTRGTPNVSDYEKWCNEAPSFLNWKNVPFWMESTRDSLCRSEMYAKARKLLLTNPYYREFYDLPETEKNKQIGADWKRRIVQQLFWGKATNANQTLSAYRDLPEIDIPYFDMVGSFDSGTITAEIALGAEAGRCVGKRADLVGWYEQHACCGRVLDLMQEALSIDSLAHALYNMMRIRKANGKKNYMVFDVFTDSQYAELLNRAFLTYYSNKSQGMLRLQADANGFVPRLDGDGRVQAKEANFGFYYTAWRLFWPQGLTVNVITHEAFDDLLTAADVAGDSNMVDSVRMLWIMDFGGMYPGILATNRKVNKTGNLDTMAAINENAACVMRTPWKEWTHYSMLWTAVVECPMGNLIIENIGNTVPDATTAWTTTGDYDSMASGAGTTTTTATAEIGVT